MIKVKFDNKKVAKDMDNIFEYSIGFLQGVEAGKSEFFTRLGAGIKEILKEYIDANARISPEALHHMYEWEQSGSPNARLFDISYRVTGAGLSFNASFAQSSQIKSGSTVPFYDKARIMEQGIPVTIAPKRSSVLAFESEGQTVFTKNPVVVNNPGGPGVQGGFERTFDAFFERYFTQAFLQSSGMTRYLKTPIKYSENFAKGVSGGKSVGLSAGYRWIVEAGEMI